MIPEFEAFLALRGKGPRSLSRELAPLGWTRQQIMDRSQGKKPLDVAERLALTALALGLPEFTEHVAAKISAGENLVGSQPHGDDRSNADDALVQP